MLSPTADTVRLFLHLLAASIWVGGQVVLVGVIPSIRRSSPETVRMIARVYARIAWPAFAIVVLTGIWNLVEVEVGNTTTAYQITVFVKILLAIASGAAAAAHQVGTSRAALAIGGAIGFLAALGAMFVGLLLMTGR